MIDVSLAIRRHRCSVKDEPGNRQPVYFLSYFEVKNILTRFRCY